MKWKNKYKKIRKNYLTDDNVYMYLYLYLLLAAPLLHCTWSCMRAVCVQFRFYILLCLRYIFTYIHFTHIA